MRGEIVGGKIRRQVPLHIALSAPSIPITGPKGLHHAEPLGIVTSEALHLQK